MAHYAPKYSVLGIFVTYTVVDRGIFGLGGGAMARSLTTSFSGGGGGGARGISAIDGSMILRNRGSGTQFFGGVSRVLYPLGS